VTETVASTNAPRVRPSYATVVWGLVLRDSRVLWRTLIPFVSRTIMNPLLFVFVFTYVFPRIGQGFQSGISGSSFATVLVPGLVAVAMVFQGVMAVAMPLSIELSATREIEDRVLAPLPVELLAVEKIFFGAVQGVVAGLVVFPLVYFIPTDPPHLEVPSWPLLILMILLASVTSGALGLALGTIVRPQHIGLMFALVVVPITFLGCVYYPWALLHTVRWLQFLVLINPLVYMTEGLRATLTPEYPHMPVGVIVLALSIATLVLGGIGVKGFAKRTIS